LKELKEIKLVLIGDQDVGKTSLIQAYLSSNLVKNLEEEGITIQILDFDEHNSDSSYYKKLFGGTHVICVCFDITRENSLDNCVDWSNLANNHCPEIPRVLIGCKLDKHPQIPQPYVQEIAELAGIGKIRVCSARTGLNVEAIFSEAIYIAENP
jgi:small GTP-binding protein